MLNKVILIGNLTRDPEQTETKSGVTVCKFSIAVNRPFTNAEGERETDFFNIVAFRGQAENCGKYLKKGSKVAVVGNLQNCSYEDKEGNKRFATEIIVSEVEFLTRQTDGTNGEEPPTRPAKRGEEQYETQMQMRETKERPKMEPVEDDDLPF